MSASLLVPSDTVKLSDKIYASVVEAILRGDFQADGKLPTETALASHFSVSRPTVREALSRLRADGIVESRRGAGSFVVRQPGAPVSRFTPIESLADIERYYAFRLCVEAGAAAGAAESRDSADMEAIHASFDALSAAHLSGASDVDADVRFHFAVARASHNPFFVATIEGSIGPIRQYMELARNVSARKSEPRTRELQAEHAAVVEAIRRRSPFEAAEAMRLHIANARRRIFEGTQLRP